MEGGLFLVIIVVLWGLAAYPHKSRKTKDDECRVDYTCQICCFRNVRAHIGIHDGFALDFRIALSDEASHDNLLLSLVCGGGCESVGVRAEVEAECECGGRACGVYASAGVRMTWLEPFGDEAATQFVRYCSAFAIVRVSPRSFGARACGG